MNKTVHTILYSKVVAVIVASTVAIAIWFNHFEKKSIQRTYTIPCCFYNEVPEKPSLSIVHAPETVQVTVAGTRKALREMSRLPLAVHINLSELKKGKQYLSLDKKNLFLHPCVTLIKLIPQEISLVTQQVTA